MLFCFLFQDYNPVCVCVCMCVCVWCVCVCVCSFVYKCLCVFVYKCLCLCSYGAELKGLVYWTLINDIMLLNQSISLSQFQDHNCVRELRSLVNTQQQKMGEMQTEILEAKLQLNEQKREIQMLKVLKVCLHASLVCRNSDYIGPIVDFESVNDSDIHGHVLLDITECN